MFSESLLPKFNKTLGAQAPYFGRNNMKTNTKLGNVVTQDLIHQFANLMGVGWPPEVIKHKMGLSSEMLQAVAQAYFNQPK